MGITRYLIVSLAMIWCGSINQTHASLPPYDTMQCWFHSVSEEPDSCLLGGKRTTCGTYRCFITVGKSCSSGNEAKLIGNECGKSLVCGCDKKCNGCMDVNGETKCHYSGQCMFSRMPYGKRSQLKALPNEAQESNLAYPFEDSEAV